MAERTWSDQIEIARPIETVFAFVSDPTTGPRWIKGLQKVEMLGPTPVQVGTKFRATRAVGPRTTTEEIQVLELTPSTRFVVGAGVMGGGIELKIAQTLTPTPSGTKVETLETARTRSFGARLMFGMFWKAVTENDAGNLRAMKAAIEGSP